MTLKDKIVQRYLLDKQAYSDIVDAAIHVMTDEIEQLKEKNNDLILANRHSMMWFDEANKERIKLKSALEKIGLLGVPDKSLYYSIKGHADAVHIARSALEQEENNE